MVGTAQAASFFLFGFETNDTRREIIHQMGKGMDAGGVGWEG